MLVRLVYKNTDRRNVLLYAFSIILSVALELFLRAALAINGRYGLNEKAGNLGWICMSLFLIAGAVSVFFVLYATGHYVRTKNRDYSLLLMLGSSRKFLFRFWAVEFALIYAFSLMVGMLAGGTLSALLFGVLALSRYEVVFSWADTLQVLGDVVRVNLILFSAELPLILLYFGKRDLSGMQRREVKRERRHDRTWFLAVGGVVLVSGAMRLLRQENFLYHFVSITVCLAGVYLLMSFGGSLILLILKCFKNFYYTHMLALNMFYYRFKSNCRLLFLMLVLDFVILFFTGAAVISQMPEDVDSAEYPYGFVAVVRDDELAGLPKELTGESSVAAVRGYADKRDINVADKGYFCISDREYRWLTDRDIHLAEGTALLINEATAAVAECPERIYLSEEEFLAVTEVRNEIIFGTEKPDALREFVVLPEMVIADSHVGGYHVIAKKGSMQREFEQYGNCFQGKDAAVFWRCAFLRKAKEHMDFVKIISIFTGGFCLLSCFGIFALKMQGDLPVLKQRYGLLYHIGMSEQSVRRAMAAEYRRILALPIVISIVLSGVYMLAQMDGGGTFVKEFVGRYIPFQLLLVCLNAMYFHRIKRRICREECAG
ncbi:MAG: hypothetical protein NC337_00215 [Roseburia sp.]|nr:hypothetical protein [Roseburia sp.]